jgi:hypothetical protein
VGGRVAPLLPRREGCALRLGVRPGLGRVDLRGRGRLGREGLGPVGCLDDGRRLSLRRVLGRGHRRCRDDRGLCLSHGDLGGSRGCRLAGLDGPDRRRLLRAQGDGGRGHPAGDGYRRPATLGDLLGFEKAGHGLDRGDVLALLDDLLRLVFHRRRAARHQYGGGRDCRG